MVNKVLITKLFCLLCFFCTNTFSQTNRTWDLDETENWDEVSKQAFISDAGRYVFYSVRNGNSQLKSVVFDVERNKSIPIEASSGCFFLKDRYFIYTKSDSLFALDLITFSSKLLSLSIERTHIFAKSKFVIEYVAKSVNGKMQTFRHDLGSGKRFVIEKLDENIVKVRLSVDSQNVKSVFLEDKNGKYIKIANDQIFRSTKGIQIESVDNNSTGGAIMLTFTPIAKEPKKHTVEDKKNLILWSYSDLYSQAYQRNIGYDESITYSGFINTRTKEIVLLEDQHQRAEKITTNAWIAYKRELKNARNLYGPSAIKKSKFNFIISENGASKVFLDNMDTVTNKFIYYITKDNRFVVYADTEKGDYYSYDSVTKKTFNLTGKTNSFRNNNLNKFDLARNPHLKYEFGYGVVAVLEDEGLIVNDGFDFWKIYPSNLKAPICLSNHYGKKNNIVLQHHPSLSFKKESVKNGLAVVLGFNPKTKQNGFFELSLKNTSLPKPIVFVDASVIRESFRGNFQFPIKASDANVWLFMKGSANSSPNWFVTNGKQIKQISNVHPEKKYNWLGAELLNWKTINGVELQGILYKPEYLDTSKKYPVIITYYEDKSNSLHDFYKPKLMNSGEIDIPTMVSRGYLVFVPDMDKRVGDILPSALESILSGTDEICKKNYVDKQNIGLSGHSYGGWETTYFVTHSNRFKAALAGAPVTDLISWYNYWIDGNRLALILTPQSDMEWSQTAMLRTLWDRPDWYIKNSPIFYADKVNTPILLMHNQKDANVPYFQGAEFFHALSRLGKPAWLLEYDAEKHLISKKENRKDFSTRVYQFFDHYLKGAEAPLWMIEGIPYKDRGWKTGLELDPLKRTPTRSPLISEEEQKRIDEYSRIPLSEKLKRIKD